MHVHYLSSSVQCGSVLGSWVKTMRDAVRNKERWKGAVRLPKILVLTVVRFPLGELKCVRSTPSLMRCSADNAGASSPRRAPRPDLGTQAAGRATIHSSC